MFSKMKMPAEWRALRRSVSALLLRCSGAQGIGRKALRRNPFENVAPSLQPSPDSHFFTGRPTLPSSEAIAPVSLPTRSA